MHVLLTDLRSALRGLVNRPVFALTVILALALGIGASTAIFSVIHAVALKPLPWRSPERIVSFSEVRSDIPLGEGRAAFLLGNVREWRDRSESFDSIGAYWNEAYTLTGMEEPYHLQGIKVTPDLFRVLGVGAQHGRVFEHQEVEDGNDKLAVFSHRAWQRYFGGNDILGTSVTLDDEIYTVIGVMPPDFAFPDQDIELWVPLLWRPPTDPNRAHEIMLPVIGRLADGVSIEQAEAEGNILLAELRRGRGMAREAARQTRQPASAEPGPGERRIVRRRGAPPTDGDQPTGGRRIVRRVADTSEGAAEDGPSSAGERRVAHRVVSSDEPDEDGEPDAPAAHGGAAEEHAAPGPSRGERPGPPRGSPRPEPESTLTLRTMLEQQVAPLRPAMRVLVGSVVLMLLIACANVANLLLGRGLQRRRELATRAALGAGRMGLGKILFVESLILSCAGGLGGLVLAVVGLRLIRALDPGEIPRLGDTGVNPTVVLFALGLSLFCAALFGLAPALMIRADRLLSSLGRDASPIVAGRSLSSLLRSGLVVVEVALALVLLIGAGLLANSFLKLSNVDPGFRTGGVLTAQVAAPLSKYPPGEARYAFYDGVLERLRSRPEVQSAGFVNFLPPVPGRIRLSMAIEGQPQSDDPRDAIEGELRMVSPGYFETMGIKLLEGRFFNDRDRDGMPPALIINQAFAERYFPKGSALRERMSGFGEIVGIVGNVLAQGLDSDPEPTFYLTIRQAPAMMLQHFDRMALVAKADSGFELGPVLREALYEIDRNVPLEGVETLEQRMSESVGLPRFYATVLGLFAAVALLMAVLGVYSVLSYLVSQQSRETGIRLAIGAQGAQVLKQTILRGMRLTLFGVALGLVGAWALGSLLAGMLFGIGSGDPTTFLAVSLLLLTTSAAACYFPGRRAAATDPVIALRQE